MNQLQRFSKWIHTSPSLFEEVYPFMSLRNLSINNKVLPPYHGNPRLGFIYQHLCTQLFESSRQYHVELEEFQINQPNGTTLGAIDLILLNNATQQYEHWEVAIKFYLLKDGTWYGPNAHDQLDKKIDRMLSHQLKMGTSPHFLHHHPTLNDLSEQLLIQGRLYINPFEVESIPTACSGYHLNQSQISGYWCYQSQFHLIEPKLYTLEKIEWATGLTRHKLPLVQPEGKFNHAQTEDGQFWFIVADSWPNKNLF
ncbi:DUF1853 family protein [Vibrio sp. FNV 38]|nr:DUF1853 family protein [Vibrio sp. FNV 38]